MAASAQSGDKPQHIGLLVFPEFELLDMAGPIEILLHLERHLGPSSNLKLTTISAHAGPVSTASAAQPARFQQTVVADVGLADAAGLDLDMLVIPGGFGTAYHLPPSWEYRERPDLEPYTAFIAAVFPRLQYLFTVCTGSGLAAKAGVLDGRRATTNKTWYNVTASLGPKTHWVAKARWVEDGKCWTAAGVSAGIDGMVALIAKVWGEETAEEMCNGTEYVRRRDAGDDPFAGMVGIEDISPVA